MCAEASQNRGWFGVGSNTLFCCHVRDVQAPLLVKLELLSRQSQAQNQPASESPTFHNFTTLRSKTFNKSVYS
jgi:hypothetical protein